MYDLTIRDGRAVAAARGTVPGPAPRRGARDRTRKPLDRAAAEPGPAPLPSAALEGAVELHEEPVERVGLESGERDLDVDHR